MENYFVECDRAHWPAISRLARIVYKPDYSKRFVIAETDHPELLWTVAGVTRIEKADIRSLTGQ